MPTGGMGGSGETTLYFFFELPTGGTMERADGFLQPRSRTFLAANATRYNFDRIETRFTYNNGRVQIRLRDTSEHPVVCRAPGNRFIRTDTRPPRAGHLRPRSPSLRSHGPQRHRDGFPREI